MCKSDPLPDLTADPGWDQALSDRIDRLEDVEQSARDDGNDAAADLLAELRDLAADGIPS